MGPFAPGWTESDVEAVVQRGIPEELLYVPIVVGLNAEDYGREKAEAVCMSLSEHPDSGVRGNAILGLGHIARTCRALDLSKAIPVVQKALCDADLYVRGHAESAADDIEQFLKIKVWDGGSSRR